MNPYFKQGICFAGAVILATTGLAQDFAVDSFTLDSGGGTSSGGAFEISGTISLPPSVAMTDGVFSVEGVFESLVSVVPPLPPEPITIFDNTTGSDNGGSGVTATAWLASRFCLGSQSYQLASVSLLLNSQDFSGGPGPPAVVHLQIYASDPVSGKPSTKTGLFMTLSSHANPVALVRGQQLVQWTNATPFTLAADTCYWAVLSRESGGRIGQIASFTKPVGDAGSFGASSSANAGATWGTVTEASNNKMMIRAIACTVAPSFAITAFSVIDGNLHLGFPGIIGQSYVIETRSELATDGWVAVPGSARNGAGVLIEVVLTLLKEHPHQFYRVRQLP
jgi:hypothetical protein